MNPTAEALHQRSFDFSVKIVAFARLLSKPQTDRVLATQVLRSGTSIGANIREAQFAQSKADFVSKLSIALKEASETQYWLELLFASGLMSEEQRDLLKADADWLVGTLVNVVIATLGYRIIGEYLAGKFSRNELAARIATATWQFARRQNTWFRTQHPEAIRIPMPSPAAETIIRKITEK